MFDVWKSALFSLVLVCACAPPPEPVAPPAPVKVKPPPAQMLQPDEGEHRVGWIQFDPQWHGASFGAYLSPTEDFADASGGVDVIFHFHGGQLAEKQWRATGINAVVVSAAFGIGSNAYSAAFTEPARFGNMIDEVLRTLRETKASGPLHARRVALVSWSAGYGSVGKILSVPKYFELVDSVVLLDSLHASFTKDYKVDVKMLDPFVRFANEAAFKRKLMVMVHSAILPPDYASSTSATSALLDAVGVKKVELPPKPEHGMLQLYRADKGDLHARGFEGGAVKDHMDHLYSVGELVEEFVVPRWAKSGDKHSVAF